MQDLNKTNLENMRILNPSSLTEKQQKDIKKKFSVLKKRGPLNFEKEIKSEERLKFEETLFDAYEIRPFLDDVIKSLVSMHSVRNSVLQKDN